MSSRRSARQNFPPSSAEPSSTYTRVLVRSGNRFICTTKQSQICLVMDGIICFKDHYAFTNDRYLSIILANASTDYMPLRAYSARIEATDFSKSSEHIIETAAHYGSQDEVHIVKCVSLRSSFTKPSVR